MHFLKTVFEAFEEIRIEPRDHLGSDQAKVSNHELEKNATNVNGLTAELPDPEKN